MSTYAKFATEAGDQFLNALAESQEQVLKSVSAFTAWMPTVPTTPALPDVPTLKEISEANFAFASKLLKQQKTFTEKLLATGTPATK